MFEYVTQKADISHEIVVQYVFQVCARLFVLAAVEESCNRLSEIIVTLQCFTFGQPPDIIMQNRSQCSADISDSSLRNRRCWRLDVEQIKLTVVITLSIVVLSSPLNFAHSTA